MAIKLGGLREVYEKCGLWLRSQLRVAGSLVLIIS